MSERVLGAAGDDSFREVVRQWEANQSAPPDFEAVWGKIEDVPSPMEASRWSIQRSLGLAPILMWAQLRVAPWLILPVALITMTLAVLAGRFLGITQSVATANFGFSSIILAGIVVTVTMAFSSSAPDSIALSMPVGPQTVVFARVSVVLILDIACGLAASSCLLAQGYTSSWLDIVTSWLIPLAFISAATTVITIWVAPWAGIVIGLILVPLAAPASEMVFFSGLSGVLRDALTPVGLVGIGVVLLALAIGSSRRAAVSRLCEA